MKQKILFLIPWLPLVSFGQHLEVGSISHSVINSKIAENLHEPQQKEYVINSNKEEMQLAKFLEEKEYVMHPELLFNKDVFIDRHLENYKIKEDSVKDVGLRIDGKLIGRNYSVKKFVEEYNLTNKEGIEFNYANTYLVIKDLNNNIVGTESFIERKVGFLKQTFEASKNYLNTASSLLCYPNPIKKNLNIKYNIENSGIYNIYISNINGQIVKTILHSKFIENGNYVDAIDLDLLDGIYIIVLESEKENISQKIIIKN